MKSRPILALFVIGFLLGLPGVVLFGQEPDSDHDGVPNTLDLCPSTAQLQQLPPDFRFDAAVNPERLKPGPVAHRVDTNGCEFDNDRDGVVNSQDFCPDNSTEALSAGVAANGCPKHSDFDGTPDYRDRCPDTPRGVATDAYGCPLVAGAPNVQ